MRNLRIPTDRLNFCTEQIRIMNQRQFGRQSETDIMEGQLTLFDSFNEVEITANTQAKEPEISEVIIASYRRKKQLVNGILTWKDFLPEF